MPDTPSLTFREVNKKTWPDFERLFEGRGSPKHCWCMVWRTTPEERHQREPSSRKAAMKKRVGGGTSVGLLGYVDGDPVAWCSVAPRDTYRHLGVHDDEATQGENVWSIACFFVVRRLRGQGFTAQLIEAAVKHAKKRGATMIEAYPVDPDSPSYRFMGFIDTFTAAGFEDVGRAGRRRHILRRRVE
jgi:GNAT superfamily N-acetyltransferase